jgi:chromosome segregation ATPase
MILCVILAVETLRKRRMALQKIIDAEESKRAKFLDEIKKATEEAEKCDNKIRDLVSAKEKLDSTITQTETALI